MSEPTAHSAVVAPDASLLSPWFPGYEIEALVAVGRMGAVYRARQLSLDRPAAIKIMARELSDDEAYCRNFEAEAKAMASLSHPNLVGIYDFGIVGGMLYLIMEFVPGRSLLESVRGVPLAQEEVVRLISGIAAGLAHAHENGVVHRDVRPSNVLLDAQAEPKLGDFGLSRSVSVPADHTRYSAPELLVNPAAADHRADVFSIGIMIHELLTGRHPIDDPRPASSIIDCDRRFDAVIQRATNAMPELRHPNLASLVGELQAILTSSATPVAPHPAAPQVTPVVTPAPAPHGKRGSIGTVALSLAAAVVGALVYKHLDRRDASPPPTAATAPGVANQMTPARPAAPPQAPSVWQLDFDAPPAVSTEPVTQPSAPLVDPAETFLVPPAKAIPVVPKFNVPSFLDEARTMMRTRAQPLVATYRDELLGNVWTFEKSMQFAVSKLPKGRNEKGALVEACIKDIRAHGNRIPDIIDAELAKIPDIDGYHTDAFARQKKIDRQLKLSLDRLAESYAVGIRKQIDRLQKEDDPAAINQLQLEIERIRDDENRFMTLMLGDRTADDADPGEWE
jgi:serine/threonine protein kinase